MSTKKKLSFEQNEEILSTLQTRFKEHKSRHDNLKWDNVQQRLASSPEKIWSLYQMEDTGGEPDVIGFDEENDVYIFCDCSPETPKGRRKVCYDRKALESRKKYPPENSAIDLANEMGIELLTEAQYKELQLLGPFDTKTSSWLKTPKEIRELGGAIFGDFRFGRTFIYHNGADSYYGVRGFRGLLRV